MTDEDPIYVTPHGGIMQHIPPTWANLGRGRNADLLLKVRELRQEQATPPPPMNRAQRRARARRSRE